MSHVGFMDSTNNLNIFEENLKFSLKNVHSVVLHMEIIVGDPKTTSTFLSVCYYL